MSAGPTPSISTSAEFRLPVIKHVGAEQIGDTIDVMFSYISGDTDSGSGYRCRVQMAFTKSGAPRPPD